MLGLSLLVQRNLHSFSLFFIFLFSFGAILFEIITRTTVFNGISPNYIELAKISQDVDPNVEVLDNAEALLKGRDLHIFLGLRKIMMKCWEANPKKRPSATQGLKILIVKKND